MLEGSRPLLPVWRKGTPQKKLSPRWREGQESWPKSTMETPSQDSSNRKGSLARIRSHLRPKGRSEGFSRGLSKEVAPHSVQKRLPDMGKQVLCSCCTYSLAGTKTSIYSNGKTHKLLTMLVTINKATELGALINSGASSNFIQKETAEQLGLTPIKREEPLLVRDIQNRSLGAITHYARVFLQAEQHQETINLNIIPLRIHGLVLRLPWLQKHNPDIKWSDKRIQFSSTYCKNNCIKQFHKKIRDDKGRYITRIPELGQLEEQEINQMAINAMTPPGGLRTHGGNDENIRGVPAKYHNFADVFDLKEARSMPSDRGVWNFKINFIDGWEDKLP
jgi:hypothetical protein